jgi:hypothetical protein
MPGVVVAELACQRCGALSYSAVAIRSPDLTEKCVCGGRRTVVRHIEDRRRDDVPVRRDRRAQGSNASR